ncbi:hypothetical protein JRI60_38870 [Archangium violaceum]|uniref:hypothetical protein n=1 Tax=Archangium violaceum TaxID=83451 RepID=UPI00194F389E|nr:hypothetical protein [Archangium violaceum]QRN95010.1 hypothetical protein JRI60_38870 [Archangium violaceum]
MHDTRPPRWDGATAMLGGLLWLVAYGVNVVFGLENGHAPLAPSDSRLAWLGAASFSGAQFLFGITLVGVWLRLRGRARWTGLVGLLLAAVPLCSAATNAVLLTGLFGPVRVIGALGALGVLGTCLGALFLGIASLRARTLPRWNALLLLALGPATVVLLVLSTLSFGPGVPAYVVDDMPFAIAGSAWFSLGLALRQRPSVPALSS